MNTKVHIHNEIVNDWFRMNKYQMINSKYRLV